MYAQYYTVLYVIYLKKLHYSILNYHDDPFFSFSPQCFPLSLPRCILFICPTGTCSDFLIFYLLLPQLMVNLESLNFTWVKHFYRQVGEAQSEWFTTGAASRGGSRSRRRRRRVYSGDSCFDGDSILIAQQPKAVEGEERNGRKLSETKGTGGRHRILCIICRIRKSCLANRVGGGESYSRRRVSAQRLKYSRGSGVSGKQSRGKRTDKLYLPSQVPPLWIKVSVRICIMLTVDKTDLFSVMEYLWISCTMWNTSQKSH